MSKNKIMPWVDALPNVEATDFQARRDQIEATMAETITKKFFVRCRFQL